MVAEEEMGRIRVAFAYGVLSLGALLMVAPFLLMLATSLMTPEQALSYPPRLWPDPVAWDNYAKAWTKTPIAMYLGNSLVVAVLTTMGQLLTCSMAGYAFARLRFPGRDLLFLVFLATMMVPTPVNTIPLFVLVARLGGLNSHWALIVPGLFGAFGIFVMRQWFLTLPRELEEAARMDGCNTFQIYWRIAMPLALPALATLGIFAFITSWNSFFWPLVVTHSDAVRTLPVGLAAFRGSFREVTDWGLLMAATAMAVVPALFVFMLGQRAFVRGIMAGSLKE